METDVVVKLQDTLCGDTQLWTGPSIVIVAVWNQRVQPVVTAGQLDDNKDRCVLPCQGICLTRSFGLQGINSTG